MDINHFISGKVLKYNQTMITNVTLLGFQSSKVVHIFLFTLILVIYISTLCGNLLIITLVSYNSNFHTPMYFFLTQLSLSDLILSTDICPNLLYIVVQEYGIMSFRGCMFQHYIFAMTECSECLLLTVMAYDRYLAICKPLHYTSIMDKLFCIKLAVMSWLLGIIIMMISTVTIACLDFCGPNIIDHFFCDALPLLNLSCSDTFVVRVEMILISIAVLFLPFLFIIVSYSNVIFTILKITSATGKQKTFSTCSSHLTVVSIFYVALIFSYGLPSRGQLSSISKLQSLFYTVGTPLVNPIIYSLRNKDMKLTFNKLVGNSVNLDDR
ncbi:olfactory receptor 13A1-like [Lithobates pipiens]